MNYIWRDILKDDYVFDQASSLLRECVQYCVRVKESSMDLAMDMIAYKSEAINRFSAVMSPVAALEANALISGTMEEYNHLKNTTVKDLVARGYELAPLELECIHATLIRIIYMRYFRHVPNTFPLPKKILASGVLAILSTR